MFEIASHIWTQENPIKAFFLYLLLPPIAVVIGLLLVPIGITWSIYHTVKSG